MNIKRKIGTQYSHYICENKIALGVPKGLDEAKTESLCEKTM